MSELEYETVVEKIWGHYTRKHGFTKLDYDLKLITGINGPVVNNTVQLDNKKDLFVLFERRQKEVSAGLSV